jgi:hypothetical protein
MIVEIFGGDGRGGDGRAWLPQIVRDTAWSRLKSRPAGRDIPLGGADRAGGGMVLWAVSDIEAAGLAEFVRLWRAAP